MAKIIEDVLLNDILNYLATRPYKEVVQGVVALSNLPEYQPHLAKSPATEENKDEQAS